MKIRLLLLLLICSIGASAQVNWNAYGLKYKMGSGDTLFYFPSNTIPVKNLSMYSRKQIDSIIQSGSANGVITAGTISFNSTTSVATFTTPFTFRINGVNYTPTQTTEALAARDATYSRIDLIIGNTTGSNGSYSHVTGVADYSPTSPSAPANTVVIAQVYRYIDGTDLVIINNNSGYLPITGGSLFGGLAIKNGNNLFLDAANGTDDKGDVVFRSNLTGTPTETVRLFSGTDVDSSLNVRFGGSASPYYKLLHTGNGYLKTQTDSLLALKSPITGGTGYIQNQNTSPQTANFNISGTGIFGSDININGITAGRGSGNDTTSTTFGRNALKANSTETYSVAIGKNALMSNTTGLYNVAVGHRALELNTTGVSNVAVGLSALGKNTTGFDNTAIGQLAFRENTTAISGTAIGHGALLSNTTGSFNTALGDDVMYYNTTGTRNTAGGSSALTSNTTGVNNTGWGASSLLTNSTGDNNTGLGYNSLRVTTSSENTAIGSASMQANTSGDRSSAFGFSSLYSNTTGIRNTTGGYFSSYSNTTGSNNVSLGYEAGYNASPLLTTVSNSTFIGSGATSTVNGITNAMALGSGATVSASNTVQLGNGSITNVNTSGSYSGSGANLSGLTASRALVTDASKNLASSTVTATELGYLAGSTSSIQNQLNALAPSSGGTGYIQNQVASNQSAGFRVLNRSYAVGGLDIGFSGASQYLLNITSSMATAGANSAIRISSPISTGVTSSALVQTFPSIASGVTLSGLSHFSANLNTNAGTITNQYGFLADATLTGATNNYGFYGNIPSSTGRWNSYMAGTAANYYNGTIQIGSVTPTAGAPKLDVTGSIGSTSLTGNRVVYSDANKVLTSSSVTDTELGYVGGVTSSIQTQINTNSTAIGLKANLTANTFSALQQFGLGAQFNSGTAAVFNNAANTFHVNILPSSVTANRAITLPDATGTMALTSDLTGKANLTNNTFTEYQDILTSSTTLGLRIRTTLTPVGDPMQSWVNNVGTVVASVSDQGKITANEFIKASGTSTQALMANGSSIELSSGSYTPTLTNAQGLTASALRKAVYTRIGNYVTVTISMDYTADATNVGGTNNRQIDVTLPIASTLGTNELNGTVSGVDVAGGIATRTGTSGKISFIVPASQGGAVTSVFTYQVI